MSAVNSITSISYLQPVEPIFRDEKINPDSSNPSPVISTQNLNDVNAENSEQTHTQTTDFPQFVNIFFKNLDAPVLNNQNSTPLKENSKESSNIPNKPKTAETGQQAPGSKQLTDKEKAAVSDLKKIDNKVKAHEAAHVAAGGSLVRGESLKYVTGPDGNRYAVGGEVKIDVSAVKGDPKATVQKMEQVKRAALAPAEPSAQDRSVAQLASSIEGEAMVEERSQQSSKPDKTSHSSLEIYNNSGKSPDSEIGQNIDQINNAIKSANLQKPLGDIKIYA